MAIYQEIEWSSSLNKPALSMLALPFFLVQFHSKKNCIWENIQFLAHLQASYYSFRMLKQIVNVLLSYGGNLPKEISQLRLHLDMLPPLTESPDLRNMSLVARKVKAMGVVQASYDMLGLAYEESSGEAAGKNNRKKTFKKSQKSSVSSKAEPKRPSNMFDVLGASTVKSEI